MKEGSCLLCGRYGNLVEHHLIMGRYRKLCDEDNLTIWICPECHTFGHSETGFSVESRIHDNSRAEDLSKMLGQALYEKDVYKALYEAITGSRNEDIGRDTFFKRYGRNFL